MRTQQQHGQRTLDSSRTTHRPNREAGLRGLSFADGAKALSPDAEEERGGV